MREVQNFRVAFMTRQRLLMMGLKEVLASDENQTALCELPTVSDTEAWIQSAIAAEPSVVIIDSEHATGGLRGKNFLNKLNVYSDFQSLPVTLSHLGTKIRKLSLFCHYNRVKTSEIRWNQTRRKWTANH